MNDLAAGLAGQGLPVADGRELVEAGIVLGLVLLSLLLGWLAGRWAGPQLTDLWRQRVGDHAVGLAARMCDIVRSCFENVLGRDAGVPLSIGSGSV